VRVGADVQLTWQDTSDEDCAATAFYIEVSRQGDDVREYTAVISPLVVSGVPYGGRWRYAVRSFNPAGLAAQTSTYLNETVVDCFSAPPPVAAVVATVVGNKVTIDWIATTSCASTGFRIAAAGAPDGPEFYSERIASPSARTWSALAPAGTWYIRVYAEYIGLRHTPPSPWTVAVVP
jgi:hypothetical protein